VNARTVNLLAPWIAGLLLLALWEVGCRLFAVPEFILPTPSASFAALVEFAGPIWFNAGFTLWVTLLGFALAVVFGLALGVIVGSSPLAYAALNPLLIGFNSVPKVALVPILVIWFGIGAVPAVLTAFLISFFPIVVNVATGIATLEPELRDLLGQELVEMCEPILRKPRDMRVIDLLELQLQLEEREEVAPLVRDVDVCHQLRLACALDRVALAIGVQRVCELAVHILERTADLRRFGLALALGRLLARGLLA